MKAPQLKNDWPAFRRRSHVYDFPELRGHKPWSGYVRAAAIRRQTAIRLSSEAPLVDGRVLDIAAAQGKFSLLPAESSFRVTWNDL